MADRLDAYAFRPPGRQRSMRPWALWLDGSIWRLRPGVDFHVPAAQFVNTARHAARRFGVKLVANIEEDSTVVFQARKVSS